MRLRVGAIVVVAGAMLLRPAGATGATLAAWVQYAPGTAGMAGTGHWGDAPASLINTILVRAVVTDAAACPAASLDHGAALAMARRFMGGTQGFVSNTQPGNFANGMARATVSWGECEAVVPPGHRIVTVDGIDLKLPVATPRRILAMGDTGCRLNAEAGRSAVQDCQSPDSFPFSYLSEFEATFRPDVILHLGDWSHRDAPCPAGGGAAPGCGGSAAAEGAIWGDTFDAWDADVFFPAKTLLAAAPWIMLRGNDESCGRGAAGWFALLDPYPYSAGNAGCAKAGIYPAPRGGTATYTADFEPSYVVALNGVNVIVHDSSLASDGLPNLDLAENYDIDLSNLLAALREAAPGAAALLATHKPTFDRSHGAAIDACDPGHGTAGDESAPGDTEAVFGGNLTLQTVFSGAAGHMGTEFYDGVPGNIALFLSGHVHQFRYINVGTGDAVNAQFAPQLILGTGGSLLAPDCSARHDAVASVFGEDAFGFAVLDRTDYGYAVQIYKLSAARAGSCEIRFNPRSINCHF